jgi:hypothetical protein
MRALTLTRGSAPKQSWFRPAVREDNGAITHLGRAPVLAGRCDIVRFVDIIEESLAKPGGWSQNCFQDRAEFLVGTNGAEPLQCRSRGGEGRLCAEVIRGILEGEGLSFRRLAHPVANLMRRGAPFLMENGTDSGRGAVQQGQRFYPVISAGRRRGIRPVDILAGLCFMRSGPKPPKHAGHRIRVIEKALPARAKAASPGGRSAEELNFWREVRSWSPFHRCRNGSIRLRPLSARRNGTMWGAGGHPDWPVERQWWRWI